MNILFFLGFMGGVFLGALLIFPSSSGTQGFLESPSALGGQDQKGVSYDAALTGAFSLKGGSSLFIPLILSELELLGVNTRPASEEKSKLLVRLKSTGEEFRSSLGSPFFLKVEERGDGRYALEGFSNERTALAVTPLSYSENEARLEVNLFLAKEEKKPLEETKEIVIGRLESSLQSSPCFSALKESKWWGEDVLLRQYGGEAYGDQKTRQKLEIGSHPDSTICFVTIGDCLLFEEKGWKEAGPDAVVEKKPLAQVTALSPKGLELTLWDDVGFYSETIKLVLQPPPRQPLNLEALPTAIRMRSETEVSCLFGKRRLILKEGDWVLRTAHLFRPLRRKSELEDYLAYRLRGELFIFDKLEKEQGKSILQGHYFDEMRTQMQKVSIPVAERRVPKSKRNHHVR